MFHFYPVTHQETLDAEEVTALGTMTSRFRQQLHLFIHHTEPL